MSCWQWRTFCVTNFVPAKILFCILVVSFDFYFTYLVELSLTPVLSFLCATSVRFSLLIGWHSNRVIWWLPFFSRVALRASRAEVWTLVAFDTSRDCRKSDRPTNYLTTRTTYLIARLAYMFARLTYLFAGPSIWSIDRSTKFSLWNTCWATALRGPHELLVAVYINSELCWNG